MKLLVAVSHECLTKTRAIEKLNRLESLIGSEELSYNYSYYINGLRNDNQNIISQLANLDISEIALELMAKPQENILEQAIHHLTIEAAKECMKEAKRLRNSNRYVFVSLCQDLSLKFTPQNT